MTETPGTANTVEQDSDGLFVTCCTEKGNSSLDLTGSQDIIES
jgi:hypothetical protein